MTPEWLMIIALWCQSSPAPYKTVAGCKIQMYQCVKTSYRPIECFEPGDDLEKTRRTEAVR